MTLCVAWRFDRRVALATDAMLGTSIGQRFDIAPKLFAIPAVIAGPIDAETREVGGFYRHTLALAYSTDELTRASTFKDLFAGLCLNLQYLGDPERISFTQIVDLAARVYSVVGEKARSGSEILSLPDVFLAGWCGDQQRVRVFKLEGQDPPTTSPVVLESLLSEADFAFDVFGTGETEMRRLIEAHEKTHGSIHVNMLRWAQQLIDSHVVPSVGGPLQFGEFVERNFELRGMVYPPEPASGGRARLMFQNIDIEGLQPAGDWCPLLVTGRFSMPFETKLP